MSGREWTCQGCGATGVQFTAARLRKWCSDRCRKQTLYATTCIDCGAQTNGSNGHAKAATRCSPCNWRWQHENAHWTKETIVAAVRGWAAEHEGPPSANDWRWAPQGYPSLTTVQFVFGSWAASIDAAGFERPAVGVHGEYLNAEEIALTVALYESGLTCKEVGARLGITGKAVWHRLERRGIPRRAQGTRSNSVAA